MMANRVTRILQYIIAALAVALLVIAFFFVHQYFVLRRARIVTAHELWTSAFIHRHGAPTPQEAALIRPWMTFSYVNAAYLLPADYLKTTFNITDTRYPILTLGAYANESGVAVPIFVSDAQTAVRSYLLSHPGAETVSSATAPQYASSSTTASSRTTSDPTLPLE